MSKETVTITKKEYENLMRSSIMLESLEIAGVDNWVGQGFAFDGFEEETGMDYWDFDIDEYLGEEEGTDE